MSRGALGPRRLRPARRWPIPLLLLGVAVLAGCAAPSGSYGRDAREPRVRCLSEADRDEPRFRPLIFFLCIESP